jgi:hypothetical protein
MAAAAVARSGRDDGNGGDGEDGEDGEDGRDGAGALGLVAPGDPGGAAGTAPRSGITVSSVTDSLSPVHLMLKEPIGRLPKDVLSQVGANPDGVNATGWRWDRRVRVVVN